MSFISPRFVALLSLLIILSCANLLHAQDDNPTTTEVSKEPPTLAERLNSLQEAREALEQRLRDTGKRIEKADETEKESLQVERTSLQKSLERVNRAFEQVATGGIDPGLLELKQEKPFNWKEELVDIVQPLLKNIKALTEKPRKIEKLRTSISLLEDNRESIDDALLELVSLNEQKLEDDTQAYVDKLVERWQEVRQENSDSIEMAQFQLSSLQGEHISWREALQESANDFFAGRGLTLLIAASAAALIWLTTRFILWVLRRRVSGPRDQSMTRYRLAAYAYSFLTSVLMVVAAIVVFYVRGDVLLLGVSILVLAGAALGLRNTLPRFIDEAKLLLNVGALREGERVIYNGVPWKVASLNLYSVLKNPAIEGIVRLPLSELTAMTSRPVSAEPWFPYEKNDYLLMPNGKLGQLVRITPDIAEIRYGGGTAGVMNTADLYTLDALNLSRNGSFGVSVVFGIDYAHQHQAVREVSAKMETGIRAILEEYGLSGHMKSSLVDFKSAGASSLDYLIFLTFDSAVAHKYLAIERLVQQACVTVCNQEGWGIPFPQMTVHSGDFHISSDTQAVTDDTTVVG